MAAAAGARQAINYGIAAAADMGMVVFHPQQPQHPHQHESMLASSDHTIIPLLTAAPCLVDDDPSGRSKIVAAGGGGGGGIQFWQPAQQHHLHHHYPTTPMMHVANPNSNPNHSLSYLKKPVPVLDPSGILSGVGGGISAAVSGGPSGGGASTCQDCGNQAKKDCSHRRCRTCCKSRGFDCSTHVKSTWVPAARRRERQHMTAAAAAAAGSSASTSASKKPRLGASQATTGTTSHTSTSNTPPRSFETSSSHHQDASFKETLPGHVSAPAVFKCVRVTSIDDGDDEYAYHAMVKIGGHVFKGFLYDHGLDDGCQAVTSGSNNNSSAGAIPNLSELHLGGGGGGRDIPIGGGGGSSSSMLPSDVFGGNGGGLMGGTNFGNQIN